MARRSERLFALGYYNDDGKPRVSYTEKTQRVCKKKAWTAPIAPRNVYKTVLSSESPVLGRVWQTLRLCDLVLFLFVVFAVFGVAFYTHTITMGYMSQWLKEIRALDTETICKLEAEVAQLKEELHQIQTKNLPKANLRRESLGAEVVHDRSSVNYNLWFANDKSGTVTEEKSLPLTPGRCWAFVGQQGHLFISLSHPTHISHVTLGHITKDQSPTGSISSAPKKFSIYGLKTLDGEETHLGSFIYSDDGSSLQTFNLPDDISESFRFVRLQIEDNHGHPSLTCLYNFRVHGRIPEQQ